MATQTNNNCNCGSNAHPECCCGHRIAVDPCMPVQNVKCKVIRRDGTSTLQAGYGVEIDNDTISVQKRDLLFDQADAVKGNETSYISLAQDVNANPLTLLQMAEDMPQEVTVDFTNHVSVDCEDMYDQMYQRRVNTAKGETTTFYGSKLNAKSHFNFTIYLHHAIPGPLAKYVERAIIASSPLMLGRTESKYNVNNYYRSETYNNSNFQIRKSFDLPEECALMIYSSVVECTRLYDSLYFRYSKIDSSGLYTFHGETTVGQYGFLRDCYHLMGKTYAQMIGSPNYASGITGYLFQEGVNHSYQDSYFDAFFCTFPNVQLTSATLEHNIHAGTLWVSLYFQRVPWNAPFKDEDILLPNMRVFFPKNEVIRKIKRLIAEGAIDEYGNELTT